MSCRSIRITAPLTNWPSGPLTSPSIAAICAHAAPAKSMKQKPPNMYPRDLASICFSSPGVKLSLSAYYDPRCISLWTRALNSVSNFLPGASKKSIASSSGGGSVVIMKLIRGSMSMRVFILLVLAVAGVFGQTGGNDSLSKAEDLYRRTDYEASLTVVRASGQADARAESLIGRDYFMLGDYKRAAEAFERAVAIE